MRRIHRAAHVWLWVALAPVVAAATLLALVSTPLDPANDLDPSIAAEAP